MIYLRHSRWRHVKAWGFHGLGVPSDTRWQHKWSMAAFHSSLKCCFSIVTWCLNNIFHMEHGVAQRLVKLLIGQINTVVFWPCFEWCCETRRCNWEQVLSFFLFLSCESVSVPDRPTDLEVWVPQFTAWGWRTSMRHRCVFVCTIMCPDVWEVNGKKWCIWNEPWKQCCNFSLQKELWII